MTFVRSYPKNLSTHSLTDMKIGIFGGAFDPPHRGHETAVGAFLKEAQLDLIYVIPSKDPPHKIISGADPHHRLELAKLAFLPLSEAISLSSMELDSNEKSYSYLTIEKLRKQHPKAQLYLFVGTDQFLAFETWFRARDILSCVTLCVMSRYKAGDALEAKKAWLEKEFGAQILLLQENAYIISSTQIREELKKEGFSHSLSPAVNEYITKRRLYDCAVSPLRESVLTQMEQTLSPSRFSHTLAVEREVAKLCDLFAYPEKSSLCLAALWHDATKEWSEKEHLAYLEQCGVAITENEKSSSATLHGLTAAILAQEKGLLSKKDADAIRYHTTGKENMTPGEKILYFADFIEETRSHAVCRRMRRHFYDAMPDAPSDRLLHLDRCILAVMEETVAHLKEKNVPIHPLTLSAVADLKRKETL